MNDAELRAVLHGLGVDDESCRVIALLPLVQVAWADGRIQDREKTIIQKVALERGLLEGEGAKLLEGWLRFRPSAGYLGRGRTALAELAKRARRDDGVSPETLGDVVALCEQVASAAGGLFDRVATVSGAERGALTEIAAALAIEKGAKWDEVMQERDNAASEEDEDEVTDARGITRVARLPSVDDESADEPTISGAFLGHTARVIVVGDEERSAVIADVHFQIGRWPDNDLQVAWDHKVSRQHCRLLRQGTRWYVVDCGTTNGTWVNEEQILERRLFGGEELRVGDTVLRFEIGGVQ
jgi:hypothetical protein